MNFVPQHDMSLRKPQSATTLGDIIAVSGSKATIGILDISLGPDDARTTVSKFVMIHSGRSRLIGLVTEVALNLPPFAIEQGYRATAEIDLMGEISIIEKNPEIQQTAYGIYSDLIRLIKLMG